MCSYSRAINQILFAKCSPYCLVPITVASCDSLCFLFFHLQFCLSTKEFFFSFFFYQYYLTCVFNMLGYSWFMQTSLCHHDGCWCLAANFAPDHQQPPCWTYCDINKTYNETCTSYYMHWTMFKGGEEVAISGFFVNGELVFSWWLCWMLKSVYHGIIPNALYNWY